MKVLKLKEKGYSNSYIVLNENVFIIIDPSHTIQEVVEKVGKFNFLKLNEIQKLNNKNVIYFHKKFESLVCLGVFVTHAHFDHIYNIEEWNSAGAVVFCSENAISNMKYAFKNASFLDMPKSFEINDNIVIVKENDIIKIGDCKFKIIETPGHTDCSLSLYGNNMLFSGDLLFDGGYLGRTDLPTGDLKKLQKSLLKINQLKKPLLVFSGHGMDFEI